MALTSGDKVPSCTLSVMGESGPAPLSTDDLFGGKRVLLFAQKREALRALPKLGVELGGGLYSARRVGV